MKSLIRQVLLATCLIGAPTCAYALPFNPGTQTIQSYLNSLKWKDGSRVIFQNLASCQINDTATMAQALGCSEGFVTIINPIGTYVCALDSVTYTKTSIVGGSVDYRTGRCRYRWLSNLLGQSLLSFLKKHFEWALDIHSCYFANWLIHLVFAIPIILFGNIFYIELFQVSTSNLLVVLQSRAWNFPYASQCRLNLPLFNRLYRLEYSIRCSDPCGFAFCTFWVLSALHFTCSHFNPRCLRRSFALSFAASYP